jgi:predicted transcriptional regulator
MDKSAGCRQGAYFTTWLSAEVSRELNEVARRLDRTRSWVVRQAVHEYLDRLARGADARDSE